MKISSRACGAKIGIGQFTPVFGALLSLTAVSLTLKNFKFFCPAIDNPLQYVRANIVGSLKVVGVTGNHRKNLFGNRHKNGHEFFKDAPWDDPLTKNCLLQQIPILRIFVYVSS